MLDRMRCCFWSRHDARISNELLFELLILADKLVLAACLDTRPWHTTLASFVSAALPICLDCVCDYDLVLVQLVAQQGDLRLGGDFGALCPTASKSR
jgi:hypothetical protein